MKFKRNTIAFLIVLLLLLSACATNAAPTQEARQSTESPSMEPLLEEGVTIYYDDAVQFELVDSQGARVLIDVEFPDKLTSPATASDILLTTNTKYHSYSEEFVDTFPGKQLTVEEGQIDTSSVTVTGIASAFTRYETISDDSTNYIYLIEMGNLRIAVLGEIGQDKLTPDQLALLGDIDIVLTQFENSYSLIDSNNKIGFNLMDQLKPKLIIPTFGNAKREVIELAAERWNISVVQAESVTISADMLSSDETQFLVMGSNAENMQMLFELPDWDR